MPPDKLKYKYNDTLFSTIIYNFIDKYTLDIALGYHQWFDNCCFYLASIWFSDVDFSYNFIDHQMTSMVQPEL